MSHPSVRVFVVVLTLVVSLALAPSLSAQGGRASISGVVTDSSGAVIPAAAVSAVNTNTGFTVSVNTNGIGAYALPLLPVGTYDVSVKKEGFQDRTQEWHHANSGPGGDDQHHHRGRLGERASQSDRRRRDD